MNPYKEFINKHEEVGDINKLNNICLKNEYENKTFEDYGDDNQE
jgi:hypothetical protein